MLGYDSKLFSKVIPSLLLQQRKCADVLQQAIHPPRLLEFMARRALFSLLSIVLTLSLQTARAQGMDLTESQREKLATLRARKVAWRQLVRSVESVLRGGSVPEHA